MAVRADASWQLFKILLHTIDTGQNDATMSLFPSKEMNGRILQMDVKKCTKKNKTNKIRGTYMTKSIR